MSTDIRVDVTRNALQELAAQIRDENQKDKRSREEQAELTGPTSRLDADQLPSDLRNPAQEDDPSNVPELYKKDELSAFATQRINLTYGFIGSLPSSSSGAGVTVTNAAGQSIQWVTYPEFGGAGSLFWLTPELEQNPLAFDPETGFIQQDFDTLQAIVGADGGGGVLDSVVFNGTSPLEFVFDTSSIAKYDRGVSGPTSGRQVVCLPVDGEKFVVVAFEEAKLRAYQLLQDVKEDGFASFVSSVSDFSLSNCFACLVSSDNIKEISAPGSLRGFLSELYGPKEKISELTAVGLVGLPISGIGGASGYQTVTVPWATTTALDIQPKRAFTENIYQVYMSPAPFGPAVYWYLRSFRDIYNETINSLADDQIMAAYPEAFYGLNPKRSPLVANTRETSSGGTLGFIVDTTVDGVPVDSGNGFANRFLPDPFALTGRTQTSYGQLTLVWDGSDPNYCLGELLNLGFNLDDLRF